MSYTVYDFFTREEHERDWLISILSDYDFDGYEETEESLKAYVPTGKTDDAQVRKILADNEFHNIEFASKQLEDRNWNEEWEKNFEPVVIAYKVAIRAPFHPAIKAAFELIIEPKMSFGTGHHATTAGMIELMLKEDFVDKTVLDFGSGTGVLAILAEKLKASNIMAIDHEEWAYHNCLENIERNQCVHISAVRGDDTLTLTEKFDIILANINRNVIMKNISVWCKLLRDKGILIVSGILLKDESDICAEALKCGFIVKDSISSNGWMAIVFGLG